ncbi:MAG: DUF3800 domain-containing protein [Elusimicrobiales bacterium]
MLYIYLDKSGDLGFDFADKRTSNFFTICVLALKGQRNDRAIANAVKPELTSDAKHFYKRVEDIEFGLYAVTLDKRKAYTMPSFDKDRVYSFIAGLTFKGLNLRDTAVRLTLRAGTPGQGKGEIPLDDYILDQIKGWISPEMPLRIFQKSSIESFGLQAAGLFARGFHSKHEKENLGWYPVFKEKIRAERLY